ncbi:MAG: dimethyl sulfoxide reductase anchor subunit [Burkholderiaceae bacterium]|nr:dimethyl sulfoxide reductase anchor subunit [Burkholderiaceae bacterium]
MRPPWSMIFFTTLAGAAQGLMLGLVALDAAVALGLLPAPMGPLFVTGAVVVLLLGAAGLVAATFHLGRPERAWRAASQWRTSWLSREVIVLPAFLAVTLAWGVAQWQGGATFWLGLLAALLALALYLCTGMIYAAVGVIREWASPLTPLNFTVLGLASGLTLGAALVAFHAPALLPWAAGAAAVATVLGAITRGASTWRNATLAPRSTLQSALGIRHPRIVQSSQGTLGGSFGTREFSHGAAPDLLPRLRWGVAVAAFVLPVIVLATQGGRLPGVLLAALALLQWAGLLGERWLFFAEGRHPQNLYYQRMG